MNSNFTTSEQSKKLLELGLPADSADCYYSSTFHNIIVLNDVNKKEFFRAIPPVWSVGRLIEIAILCTQHYTGSDVIQFQRNSIEYGLIECLIALLQISKDDGDLDFSKLED